MVRGARAGCWQCPGRGRSGVDDVAASAQERQPVDRVACVTAAMLALASGLRFDPICLSMLFLGVTLVILLRPATDCVPRSWWLLPPLFVLWVNLDAWFVL